VILLIQHYKGKTFDWSKITPCAFQMSKKRLYCSHILPLPNYDPFKIECNANIVNIIVFLILFESPTAYFSDEKSKTPNSTILLVKYGVLWYHKSLRELQPLCQIKALYLVLKSQGSFIHHVKHKFNTRLTKRVEFV